MRHPGTPTVGPYLMGPLARWIASWSSVTHICVFLIQPPPDNPFGWVAGWSLTDVLSFLTYSDMWHEASLQPVPMQQPSLGFLSASKRLAYGLVGRMQARPQPTWALRTCLLCLQWPGTCFKVLSEVPLDSPIKLGDRSLPTLTHYQKCWGWGGSSPKKHCHQILTPGGFSGPFYICVWTKGFKIRK